MIKKILSLIICLSLLAPTMITASTYSGMPGYMVTGITDVGSVAGLALDSAYAARVSGDSAGLQFTSKRAQTAGDLTLYASCTAATGSPLTSEAILYTTSGAADPQRPNLLTGMATSTSVDVSGCGTQSWLTYTWTDSATLALSENYFIVITNTTASPNLNHFTIQTRGALDAPTVLQNGNVKDFQSYQNTDGISTDPTLGNIAPMVLKYDDGTVYGMPFVTAGAAHASNANERGCRASFLEDTTLLGFYANVSGDTDLDSIDIYTGSTLVQSTTADVYNKTNNGIVMLNPAIVLDAGVIYDFIGTFSNNAVVGRTFTMGNSPPADVQAVNTQFTYVDGAAVGSLTEVTTTVFECLLFLDTMADAAAPAASSAGAVIINGSVVVP